MKIDPLKIHFLLKRRIFQHYVSLPEGNALFRNCSLYRKAGKVKERRSTGHCDFLVLSELYTLEVLVTVYTGEDSSVLGI